jgi:hypothetical protein
MKKTLLSLSFAIFSLFANAQLEYNLNFNSGEDPAGFVLNGVKVDAYEIGDNCESNNGLITTAGVASNGKTAISLLTPSSLYSPDVPNVTLSFKLYAFQANLKCEDLLAAFPCPTTFTVYLVKPSFDGNGAPSDDSILGQSDALTVTPNTLNSLILSFDNPPPVGAQFKVYLDINTDCGSGGGFRFVIDDVRIFGIGQTTLPVNFKNFNAVRINSSSVGVQWTTTSEQNNKGFYVQRNDGEGWKNMAFVFSKTDDGNSSVDQSYSFNDVNTTTSISQYRIMQVDLDGRGRYSSIRSIRGEGAAIKTLIFPNPSATGNINVIFENAAPKNVLIIDAAGRLVKSYPNEINSVEVTGLRKGFYMLQIIDRKLGIKKSQKIVVQ